MYTDDDDETKQTDVYLLTTKKKEERTRFFPFVNGRKVKEKRNMFLLKE